ncbi:hypothetical protein H310_01020 [Aphanomyces invadans]|uniref:EF-hand domain-containing protein n=1 Tax=Aphanomyces invadans TaxID=157072 RepID=A0A024UQ95_9STRA|nr:hypothetical protein H310_01020 [Aphanomyces invadans]ETW08439.1 hypothetical protein H310_01020 [Aphanomyces invadans]|eukprot:XP_008862244.1 hypothetical protein H310_01020 [Aphanomyces invadans]
MFKRKKLAATAPVDPLAALGDPKDIAKDFPLFSSAEIKAMQKQFVVWLDQACIHHDGRIMVEVPSHVVVDQPKVALNGLFALAIRSGPGHTVTFLDFMAVTSLFHPKTPLVDKQNAMFRLYDVDRDGVVSPADAHHVLTQYLGFTIDISAIAASMQDFMTTSAVGLTSHEFHQMVTDSEVLAAMTIL